jgi:hypothetical protein
MEEYAMKHDPWNERYAWYWYNDQEIFYYTEEDFDRKAREFSDSGINIVITFSNTHFRWSFINWWDLLTETLRKIVTSCHKYGIKVVEHHSSQYTFNPLNDSDWQYVKEESLIRKRNTDLANWKGLPELMASDNSMVNGKLVSTFRQIDGSTGCFSRRSGYSAYLMCFNNPDYRTEYFKYLKAVCATGIDGIMNDDVQYAPTSSCTCIHCRKLFKEKTGYDLPYPDKWKDFENDYDNPVFIAFKRFKLESTTDFKFALDNYYKSLGYNLLRPNYISTILESNWSCTAFETSRRLWTNIFQENIFSSIIKYSYPSYLTEAIQRFAMARQNNVPSMSLFYPKRFDDFYFSWSLSKLWGQSYTATQEGYDLNEYESKFRSFEQDHYDFYIRVKKVPDVAFYQSSKTRDYTKDAYKKYVKPFLSWMQASHFSGLNTDMVFEYNGLNELQKFPCIVVSNVAMMSDNELKNIRDYAETGGKLIIIGICGRFHENGNIRPFDQIVNKLGLNVSIEELDSPIMQSADFAYKNNTLRLVDTSTKYKFTNVYNTNTLLSSSGIISGIYQSVGCGEIVWLLSDVNNNEYSANIVSNRRLKIVKPILAEPSPIHKLRYTSGKILNILIGDKRLSIESGFSDILASCFSTEKKEYAIHLVNINDTLLREAKLVSHDDVIEAFCGNYALEHNIRVQLKKDIPISKVCIYTPENDDEKYLNFDDYGDTMVFDIPGGLFGGYALIEVK